MSGEGLAQRLSQRLDQRLMAGAQGPVCIGLSGGGDSVALLLLVTDWARERGRRVLALSVDHRLNPHSADWTRYAGEVARAAGADWQALNWAEARGGSGVSARARRARHGLLADAARQAGARVILMAHTLDDVAEGEWMRADGVNLGQLRDWAPSPVWPQGRGVMLFRPLLQERREDLRAFLRGRGQGWIDDPANEDLRYGRVRARQALAGVARTPQTEHEQELGVGGEPASLGERALSHSRWGDRVWGGVIALDRQVSGAVLAAALVCAGGGERPPRGERLQTLQRRLRAGEDFTASLAGARVEAEGLRVELMREPGEFARQGLAPVNLLPGEACVWDGRFEIRTKEAGWSVVPGIGRLGRLESRSRQMISVLPSAARMGLPVLKNTILNQVVLPFERHEVQYLGAHRLALTLGEKTQESDLFGTVHGVKAPSILFSDKD